MKDSLNNYQQYIDVVIEYGTVYGSKVLLALIVFMIGKRVARLISNLVIKALKQANVDNELIGFLESLIYWGLFALVVIAALGQLGVQTASFIAILGAAGLAVGLALQGSLSNFAASVLILILRPFNVGDYVQMAGTEGSVENINIFTTKLLTPDNKSVIVPNSRVLESNIVNFSSTGERRVDMVFGIGYDDDVNQAQRILEQIAAADQRILHDKETRIALSELADSSVNFIVRPWVKTADYWDVLFDFNVQVKKQFDENGISIPYPQSDVHLIQTQAVK